mgnify:CR=1 FL=1
MRQILVTVTMRDFKEGDTDFKEGGTDDIQKMFLRSIANQTPFQFERPTS